MTNTLCCTAAFVVNDKGHQVMQGARWRSSERQRAGLGSCRISQKGYVNLRFLRGCRQVPVPTGHPLGFRGTRVLVP